MAGCTSQSMAPAIGTCMQVFPWLLQARLCAEFGRGAKMLGQGPRSRNVNAERPAGQWSRPARLSAALKSGACLDVRLSPLYTEGMTSPRRLDIFLATAPGLEDVLCAEVRSKGFNSPRAVPGGV